MKQTAVEWLIEELKALDWWYLPNSIKKDIFDQAKAMEKEQIVDAYNTSWALRDKPYATADKYYNENYEKKKDCCPKCNEKENFHINYDYSKSHKPVVNILCNECGTYFSTKSE